MATVKHDADAATQAAEAQRRMGEKETMPESQSDAEPDKAPGDQFVSYSNDGPEQPAKKDPPDSDTGDKGQDDPPSEDQKGADGEERSPEDKTGEEDPDNDSQTEEQRRSKNKKPARERIKELTQKYRGAERESAELRSRIDQLESQLQQRRQDPGRASDDTADADGSDNQDLTDTADGDTVEPKRPDPKDFDYGEIDPRYIEALTDYRVETRLAKEREERQKQEQRTQAEQQQSEMQEKFLDIYDQGSEKYDDFEEKVLQGVHDGTWPLSQQLAQLTFNSDHGADILYHLASHPDEAESVFHKTPLEQAAWFGAVQARLSSDSSDASQNTARVSQAPEPVRQPRGSSGKFKTQANTDSFKDFERLANEELKHG